MSVEGKKSRPWLWLVILVIGILFVTSYVYAPPASPSYDGRSAESWLAEPNQITVSDQMAPIHAFEEMGPNGIIFLVHSLNRQDSELQKFYEKIFPKFPFWLMVRLPRPMNAEDRIEAAEQILARIHDTAPEQTFPLLVKYLKTTNPCTRAAAAYLISYYPKRYRNVDYNQFRPDLIRALSDTNDWTRIYIVTTLRDAKLGGSELIAVLQPLTTNSDADIQESAQETIHSLKKHNSTAP